MMLPMPVFRRPTLNLIASEEEEEDVPEYTTTRKTVTFTGGAGAGAVGTITLFTTTEAVVVSGFVVRCSTNLTEAGATATIAVGTETTAEAFCPLINAVDLDAGELWAAGVAAPAAAVGSISPALEGQGSIAAIDEDIILTVGAEAVNGGVIEAIVFWKAASTNGALAAAS